MCEHKRAEFIIWEKQYADERRKKEQIGVATMQPDGTIKIYMGFKGEHGEMVDGFAEYKTDNPAYQDIIKRLGGIKPDENKPYFKS
jgi:hypothetical protein